MKIESRLDIALIFIFLGYLLLSYSNAMSKPLYEVDDYAWLYTGWRISEGDVLYRDVFEFHPPLTDYIASLAFAFSDDATGAVFALKRIDWLLSVATAGAVFLLGSRLFGNMRGGLLSALAYGYGSQIVIFRNVFEPLNVPTALFISLGAYFAACFVSSNRKGWIEAFLAGAFFSLAALSSQRAVFALPAAALALLAVSFLQARREGKLQAGSLASRSVFLVPFLAGALIPWAVFIAYLFQWGAFESFVSLVFGLSSEMNSLSVLGMGLVHAEAFFANAINAPYLWPVGSLVLLAVLFFEGKKAYLEDAPVSGGAWLFLSLFASLFALGLLALIRFKATHIWFPLFPILALFAAYPLIELAGMRLSKISFLHMGMAAYAITLLFLFPVARSFQLNTQFSDEYGAGRLERQLEFARHLNEISGEDELLFDSGLSITRKSAYFYHYDAYGGSGEGLVKALEENKVRVVATYSQKLPEEAEKYIQENYFLERQSENLKAYLRK